MNRRISVVTAYFDIGRGAWNGEIAGSSVSGFLRSNDDYLHWFENLSHLRNDMVIFTESKFACRILDLRRKSGLESITTVFTCDDLFAENGPLSRELAQIKSVMSAPLHRFVRNPACPEHWNEQYVMLTALKAVFVCTAITMSATAEHQVAWIDFGYCRDSYRFEPTVPWRFDTNDRMNLFYIRKPDNTPIFDIVRTGEVYFQGCHIVGPAECWYDLRRLVDDAIASLLDCGLVDDDQTTLLMAYRRAPDLFRIHAVDPRDWFVIFRNFNQKES